MFLHLLIFHGNLEFYFQSEEAAKLPGTRRRLQTCFCYFPSLPVSLVHGTIC